MTLRARLTFFYTVLLGVTLVAFSALLYVLLQNSLLGMVDRVLTTSMDTVQNQLVATVAELPLQGGGSVLTIELSPIGEFTTPGIYVQLMDLQGRIRARSANLSGETMPINSDVVQAALAGTSTLMDTNPGRPAEPLRVLTRPIIANGSVAGVLQVATSLYNVRMTMRLLLIILLTGVLATMLIVAAVIWMLTGRALRPLDTVAKTAEYIGSSQDLSQRLTFGGKKDEVGRLARAFNAMIGRLEAAFNAQKQFVADSSHELRTPLTVIRGNLDLMKRDPRPENRAESLANIEQEAVRMGKIVDELMLLAQIDAAQAPACRPVALDEVTLQVYHQTRVLATDKQVTLGHVDGVRVMADHDRLVQMLLNLVDNAIKYTPAGGVVTIECWAPAAQHPGLARLAVTDTGIGIAAEDIAHIFDRFYRVDKAHSRAQGGTGLGLAIVKSIAESYGGRVTVESEAGKGSTFTVLLPVS